MEDIELPMPCPLEGGMPGYSPCLPVRMYLPAPGGRLQPPRWGGADDPSFCVWHASQALQAFIQWHGVTPN